MKSINCLLIDTETCDSIKEIMALESEEKSLYGGDYSVQDAFNSLSKQDIEVDVETVATLYEDALDLNNGMHSSQKEVDAFANREFENQKNLMLRTDPFFRVKSIEKLSPGDAVAHSLFEMFHKANTLKLSVSTDMRMLQDAVKKAATRVINKRALPSAPRSNKTWQELLSDAFHFDDIKFKRLDGFMNSIFDVWEEAKEEIERMKFEMKRDGASEARLAQFDDFVGKMISTSYNLALSTNESKKILRELLMKAGYGKEVHKNGKTYNSIDWTKLTGNSGTEFEMKKNIAEVLKDEGYNNWQIRRIQDALYEQMTDLRARIIQNSVSNLDRRNQPSKYSETSAAKRLANANAMGLFEALPNQHDFLVNKLFGVSGVSNETFKELATYGKALQLLYETKWDKTHLGERQLKTMLNDVNNQIAQVLRRHRHNESMLFRVADYLRSYMDFTQRMILTGVKNMFLQNQISGLEANIHSQISTLNNMTPEMRKQTRESAIAVYKNIVLEGGSNYGDVTSQFVVNGQIDDYMNGLSDTKLYHGVMSFVFGRMLLDGTDSKYKSQITEHYIVHNLIRILTDDTNPKKMSKEDAQKAILEHLYGKSFEDAKQEARDIIARINQGKKILPTTENYINRVANDLVKAQLLNNGTITKEQLTAAIDSAYKAAGRDLGHVANNPLSKIIQNQSSAIQRDLDKSLKQKNYNKAFGQTIYSIFWRNFANPMVAGAFNWVGLKVSKMGLGILVGGYNKLENVKSLDLSTKTGIKLLEEKLYSDLKSNAELARGLAGGIGGLLLSSLVYAALKMVPYPDDDGNETAWDAFAKWRRENWWATKFSDELSPEPLLILAALKTDGFYRYVSGLFNHNPQFDPVTKAFKGVKHLSEGNMAKAEGELGDIVGSRINLPIPLWRPVKDVVSVINGIRYNRAVKNGETPDPMFKYDFSTSKSFWEGMTKGGLLEWAGYNYKAAYTLETIPGIGPTTLKRLRENGINTLEDIGNVNLRHLKFRNKNGKKVRIIDNEEAKKIHEITK